MDAVLLHFDDETQSAQRLARACGIDARAIGRHRFPDGELKLTLPASLGANVILLRSLDQPNEKLIEVLLAAQGARAAGVRQLTLVAPYLAYMRQDIAFHPGEVVSQLVIGRFLAGLVDALVTVDPHLHRVATLREAVPLEHANVVSAAPVLADLIEREWPGALLLGPDAESAQWVRQAAARHGFDYGVCTKARRGDREVSVTLPDLAFHGRDVVLLDDMASTGRTLARAAEALRARGAGRIAAAVTHALFADDAVAVMRSAGIGPIWSTDCIRHPSNAVAMADALAAAVAALYHCSP